MSDRNPEWTVERDFTRGQVYFVALPEEPELPPDPSFVMHGDHRVVVLFDSHHPRKTVTVLPISSLHDSGGNEKETFVGDLILSHADYDASKRPFKGTITRDSYIKTEQLRTVSRHYLERQVGELLPEDMVRLDLRLIATLQLQDTVSQLIESEVQKRLQDLGYGEEEAE